MGKELSHDEAELVRHVEVLGMPVSRAGQILGIGNSHEVMQRPHVMAARDEAKRAVQQRTKITKEDVIEGIKTAVDQAYTLADPTAQIRGWSEIGKLLDFYTPTKINVYLTGAANELRRELSEMDDQKLLELAEEDPNVIDGDFYKVENGARR